MPLKEKEVKLGSGVLHPGARPMEVVEDAEHELWLCDKGIDPKNEWLLRQNCWRLRDLAFTRND